MLNKAPDTTKEWKALARHYKKMSKARIADSFAQDVKRFDAFHLKYNDFLLDYSKQNISSETLSLLMELARVCSIEQWRESMFTGAKINESEGRAVLHTELRNPVAAPEVQAALEKIKVFSEVARAGHITDVVNIGIGGSDLGPHMVCEALKAYATGPRIHFVSNVDGSHLAHTLKNLKPETTLFIIASKTFTTQETMTNAESAKAWAGHTKNFIAVTSHERGAVEFGISADHIFPLWDWVGGRYSLWSAIGLCIALSLGYPHFRRLLQGAHEADLHFRRAPLESNIPVIMGLLGVWQRNFCDASALAVLPYAQDLNVFPAWLQQLDMESNGKSYDRQGRRVRYKTSPVVFGGAGTNGQHAFYQMLHQGTDIIPCDFIVAAHIPGSSETHQEKLLANALGQSQALMQGQSSDQAWNIFEGNRPSSTILIPTLDPYYVGMLLAFYEHKIFVQGIIWNLNSFDQWGVELGKTVSNKILSFLQAGNTASTADSSTQGLVDAILTGRHT